MKRNQFIRWLQIEARQSSIHYAQQHKEMPEKYPDEKTLEEWVKEMLPDIHLRLFVRREELLKKRKMK